MDYKKDDEYAEEAKWFPALSWWREALLIAAMAVIVYLLVAK